MPGDRIDHSFRLGDLVLERQTRGPAQAVDFAEPGIYEVSDARPLQRRGGTSVAGGEEVGGERVSEELGDDGGLGDGF